MKNVIRTLVNIGMFCAMHCAQAQIPVLYYNGASGGDWWADGVWLDESGQPANWADGSVAVITNASVNLTANASVYGFRVSFSTRYAITGSGKLTLGAGGIFTDTGGEFNIACAGGLHLPVSQEWRSTYAGAAGTMFCLDGRLPITSAPGVVLTIDNGRFRTNAGGGLTDQCTVVILGALGYLSPASGASLGENKMVFEGPGLRFNAAGDTDPAWGVPVTGSEMFLNNGASIQLSVNKQCRLPLLTVASPTGTVASAISGNELSLTNAVTELLLQDSNAALNVSTRLTDGSGVASAVRKTGPGALQFTGQQGFSGGLLVDAGPVAVSAAGGLGGGSVTLAGGTTLELAANANLGVFANAIGGAGAVTKTGANAAGLSGANTYTGGTAIQDGTVRVAALSSFGTGTVTLNNNTIAFMADVTLSDAAVSAKVLDAGTLKAENDTTLTWDDDYSASQAFRLEADTLGNVVVLGSLTGNNDFVKTDPGMLTITNTAGYTGVIRVENGILIIGDTTVLESGVTVETYGTGAVQLDSLIGQNLSKIGGTGSITFPAGTTVSLDTDTDPVLSVALNATVTISNLSGAGDLIKKGPGTMVVTAAPGFTGKVLVLEGTLHTETALGANTITVSNGTFRVDNATLNGNALTLVEPTAVLAVTNSGSLGFGTLAVNTGILRVEAGGSVGGRAVTLSNPGLVQVADGAGFDSGSLAISGGELQFTASTVMAQAPTFTANCYFRASQGTAAEISGHVTGSAKLMVIGGGRVTFSGGATINGEIFVQQAGTEFAVISNKVSISRYAGLEGGGKRFLIKDGGEVELTGGTDTALHVAANQDALASTFEIGDGGTFRIANGAAIRLGHSGASLGILRVSGGTALISGNSEFVAGYGGNATGRVELVSGLLQTSRQLRRNTTGSAVFSGGTLQSDGALAATPWIAENMPVIVESAGGTIDVNGLDITIGSDALTGPGTLTATGGGTAHFYRPSPGWTGGIIADACAIGASATNALGAGTLNLGNNALSVTADALLPNAIRTSGGIISVGEGLTALTGITLGGAITKTGAGGWVADTLLDDVDLSIQEGQVKVEPSDACVAALQAVAGNPAFWVDAASTASIISDGIGRVTRWDDRRTPNNPDGFSAYTWYNSPVWTPDRLNGLPVMDFGNLGQTGQQNDNRMMAFKDYLTNIRTVFWVIGSRNGGGFLLGDSQADGSARHFHRAPGSESLYGGLPQDPLWAGADKGIVRAGDTWVNAQQVDGTTTGLSGGFDLVTWRLAAADDAMDNTPGAYYFASCYAANDGRLNGGQDLGEVLIYTNRLSDAERALTEFYLARKWFPNLAVTHPAIKSVSLDGAGVSFANGYAGTYAVQIAELIINAAGVSVSGNPVAVSKLTVTGAGELQCDRLQTLETGAIEIESGATVVLDADAPEHPTLFATGTLTLPNAAFFRVDGTTKLPPGILLIKVQGAVTGTTQWAPAPGNASAPSRIEVRAPAGEVWLRTAKGTVILLK